MLAICWLLLQLGTDPVSLCSSSSFFFFFFPYKFLCSRSEIIRSPSELYSSSCSFISSRSDHNFIPVYWPKFTEKAETKRNHSNLKNQSWFTKPDGRTAVHAGPCFFGMEWFKVFPFRPYNPVRVSKPWCTQVWVANSWTSWNIGSGATLNCMLRNVLFWIWRTSLIDANPDILMYALEQ